MTTTLQNVTPDGKKLIAVEVPVDAPTERYADIMWACRFAAKELPEGEYTAIGTCTHDTIDFDVEPYCHKDPNHDDCYLCYGKDYNSINHAGTSFRSLLSAAGLEFNNNNKYVILKQI